MSRFFIVSILILALMAGAAAAQLDPGPDGIGLYADLEGNVNGLLEGAGQHDLYLLLNGYSVESGLRGWELSLDFPPSAYLVGYSIPYAHINVGIFPSYTVGLGFPMAQAEVMHLATFTFMVMDSGPVDVFLKSAAVPIGGSLGNYLPCFADGDHELGTMYPSSGSVDLPVFRFNGEAPVATEPASLDRVKALYR